MAAVSTTAFIDAHRGDSDPALAQALVETAGGLALTMRDNGLNTGQKTSVSDVVTDADMAAERFVAEALSELRPDDGIVGEEGTAKPSASGRTWVIDPVDGTYNFASGSDYFCSALALIDATETVLTAAVHRPALDQTWLVHEGAASENGSPLPPLASAPLRNLALATYLHPTSMQQESIRDAWQRPASQAATVRMFGAGSIDLATVASGGIGGWLQHSVADWDWLPGKALVEAVGGKAIKVDAGGVTWCVAGNPLLVDDVTAALAG